MPSTRLRVAFLGNIANTHFRLARALREGAGIDAHVYVSDSDAPAWRPESDDPSLAGDLPPWVHQGDWVNPWTVLNPGSAPIVKSLARYDLVVVSGLGPIFAQHAGRPWAFLATGADLTVKPFPLSFWRWPTTWPRRAANLVIGSSQRRAIRRADRVLLQPFAPMVDAADRLGLSRRARSPLYFPLPVDTARFSPEGPVADLAADADFVVFHPSRMVLNDSRRMRRTGQWKGNDKLLLAFAHLVRSGAVARPRLVLVDQPASRDRDRARAMTGGLGIANHVVWARPPDGEHFTQPEMAALYRRADVVVDEFGVGWFGFVTLEGCATGRPVLSYLDEQVMSRLYPWHPVTVARTAADAGARLVELASSPERRQELGARSRQWAQSFHSPAAVTDRYVLEFDRLAGELLGHATKAKAATKPIRTAREAPPVGKVATQAQVAEAATSTPSRPQA